MTNSQAFFWLSMAAFCGWAPPLLLIAVLVRRDGAPSVAAQWLQVVRESFAMSTRWQSLAKGQKLFLLAASLSAGPAVIFLARAASALADWACVHLGGLPAGQASLPAPLGSWLLVWELQAASVIAFYAWLQFAHKPRRV